MAGAYAGIIGERNGSKVTLRKSVFPNRHTEDNSMALLPPKFLRSVVAIGIKVPDTPDTQWIGTGFIYGVEGSDSGANTIPFLVTNAHVIEEEELIFLKMNRESGFPAVEYEVDLVEFQESLTYHPGGLDLVVLPLRAEDLNRNMVASYPIKEEESLSLEKAKEIEVAEGDGVFAIGFPLGLAGYEDQNFPIVKQGCIARIQDWLSGNSRHILVDANIFPGNSGGPIFLQPSHIAFEGTRANSFPYLIGMVSAYIPYEDVAVSLQTKRPRVVFEENSGIVEIVPSDAIIRTIELAMRNV